MFNKLIILIAVINLAKSQESPEADDIAILSGLTTATLDCSLNFDREFVAENEAIAAAIEEMLTQREESDAIRQPKERRGRKGDKDDEAELTEAPTTLGLRRNLRKDRGDRRRGDDSDVASEPKDATREPRDRKNRDDDFTREPKDATREPRGRKSRDEDKVDVTGEAESTEAPTTLGLRRNLRKDSRRDRRRGDDKDVTREPKDATREPKDATREPRERKNRDDDSTKEPCDDDKVDVTGEAESTDAPTTLGLRRNLRKGDRRDRRRGDDKDVTREPKDATREPKDATREPRERKSRDDDSTKEPCDDDKTDVTGEAGSTDAPTTLGLRRLLRKDRGNGRDRRRGEGKDVTREPKDATREPRERKNRDGDSTKEPCDDDKTDVTGEAESTDAPTTLGLRRNLRKDRSNGRERRRGDDKDVTREPKDATREPKDATREPRERKSRDDKTDVTGEAESTDAPTTLGLRRNLRKDRSNGRERRRGDDKDVTREPKDATREPKDATREPRERKHRDDDSTREPCDDDKTDVTGEVESTDAPTTLGLRRNLRKDRGNRRDRRRGDNEVTSDDSTREPKDGTREPKDVTREPCDSDNCENGRKRGKGRKDSDDSSDEPESTVLPRRLLRKAAEQFDDSTKEPCDRTREPCVGDECGRKGRKQGRKSRKGEDVTTEAPELPRRALGRNGERKSKKGLGATISNGNVDIAGVTGEVVFGDVDEASESIPLTFIVGETFFQCDLKVRGSNKVSCTAVSNDDFRVRVGCELEL